MIQPVLGQRWVSDSEPELGLGMILKTEFGRVEVLFPAANERRQYALKTSALRRVQFHEGDTIKTHDGHEYLVEQVEERNGLLFYLTKDREVPEAQLSDTISFSKPEDRLLGAQVDDFRTFEIRAEALHRRCEIRKSPVRGYIGGRVDLLSHQMSIAAEVASRYQPRVLLADEVGLGKTIEACLILHRLHLTGRANRVLIVVPEPLVHQWFVELLRRFNLMFSIYDEERCAAAEVGANPFLENALILASLNLFVDNEEIAQQAKAAGWELLIVDEAHHLEWSQTEASAAYQFVESLATQTPALLLLTATPQQLGVEGHFARLRLLDPERYSDLDAFLEESAHYEEVAETVNALLAGEVLTAQQEAVFESKSPRIKKHYAEYKKAKSKDPQRLIQEILDEFGTGRVMFRNTRAALSGFPERKAHLHALKGDESFETKLAWLVKLIKKLKSEKILLICKTQELSEELHEAVLREININVAFFHEGLSLVQRDRNAAYFAEEEGAQLLLCSEIGSEGRNFQFAHHLVLFDLPRDPELLEQRIGRLDRIGQSALIEIHVPYLKGSEEEVLARWYHEGLNAFEKNPHGATEIAKAQMEDLEDLIAKPNARKLPKFLQSTQELKSSISAKLERGHDRLLELNSHRPELAALATHKVRDLDEDIDFEEFFLRIVDHFGVDVEDHGNRSYVFKPGHLLKEPLPTLTEEGMFVTFNRTRALSREDMGFISWDHPLVRGALDQLIGSEQGNSSFAVWKAGKEMVFLELYYVLETVAPSHLHVDGFLPATPIRVVVDHTLVDQSDNEDLKDALFQKGDVNRILEKAMVKQKLIPAMLKKGLELAELQAKEISSDALKDAKSKISDEIERLEDLKTRNPQVKDEEIQGLKQQLKQISTAIQEAHLRLDSIRMILRIP